MRVSESNYLWNTSFLFLFITKAFFQSTVVVLEQSIRATLPLSLYYSTFDGGRNTLLPLGAASRWLKTLLTAKLAAGLFISKDPGRCGCTGNVSDGEKRKLLSSQFIRHKPWDKQEVLINRFGKTGKGLCSALKLKLVMLRRRQRCSISISLAC